MSSDATQILTVRRGKRTVVRFCAIVLFTLGALPSAWVSFFTHSILPFLGGLYLAFVAYHLMKASNLVLEIGREGISLGEARRRQLTLWCDLVGFSQGSGIDRHKVAIALASDPTPRRINLGLLSFECRKVRYLPDAFGMKAKELADFLNRARDQYVGTVRQSEDVSARP